MTRRVQAWLDQWGPMLPLLIAEAVIWVGFAALFPILTIYFTEHGVDLPMLGVVVAAWPAARLVGEPVFGWLADRVSRKAMMVVGLVLTSVFAVMPLFVSGPAAFIVIRALTGLCAAIYDPAARGYLVDANPPGKRGEAFGLYGAAQMGGLMLGPAVGGFAAALTGMPTIVFWVASVAVAVSAVLVVVLVRELPRVQPAPAGEPDTAGEGAAAAGALASRPVPTRLLNRLLVTAIVFNVGGFFASGSYEVVWSLFLTSLGAGYAVIGLTFFTFALPILTLSPVLGRWVDRRGGFLALVVGLFVVGVCGAAYGLVAEVWFVVLLGLVEGTAFAVSSPALYLLVARASPVGRSSTAQGIFGASGTVGTIIASLSAGVLAGMDLRYPFFATAIGIAGVLGIGLLVGGRRLYDAMQPDPVAPGPGEPAVAEAVAG